MKIKQDIPWYKNEYLGKKWLIKKISHYVFYYFQDSLAAAEIEEIITLKESHYDKILSFLGLECDQIINYYIYPSLEDKKALMGDDSPGNVIWEDFELINSKPRIKKFEIHVVYSNKCKFVGEHEDTHLLSLPLGLSIYLFCEGLAQFMEGSLFGKDVDIISKELLNENKLYPVKNLFDNKSWNNVKLEIVYPEVGSFVRFLINTYGLNKFKEVYERLSRLKSLEENLKTAELIFNRSIVEIEIDWKKKLIDTTCKQN